jgi:hypothetical protein
MSKRREPVAVSREPESGLGLLVLISGYRLPATGFLTNNVSWRSWMPQALESLMRAAI